MEHALTANTGGDRATRVPFVDLGPVTRPVSAAVLSELTELMGAGAFVNGPPVREFEERFASFCGRAHCVGVANGLDALRLALAALGVGPGDEVVVPAMTFVATFEAVAQVGATPVPVDVREDDSGLDPDASEAALTSRTRALLPVHLYGQMADMRRIGEIARRHDVVVVEDAAQAHGAARDGLRAGACGEAGAFSFYPSKNLGAMGDAGALVTDDARVAEHVRALREHGETGKYRSEYVGYTSRLDALQAVVLSHKLPLLEAWNDERREAAAAYGRLLAGIGDLRLPETAPGALHVWHLYTIRTAEPEELAAYLKDQRIATGRHYPEPPHLSGAFAGLGHGPGSFPVAEAIARETLSLPLFPGITEEQTRRVASAIESFFAGV
jgi:dTDP-4-amino-4,6-dideoxygalactose transaminase